MMLKTFNTLSFLVVILLLLTTGVYSMKTEEEQGQPTRTTGVRGAGASGPSSLTTSSYECPVNALPVGAQCEIPDEPHVCEYLHIQVPSDFDPATGVCSGDLICKPTAICGCGSNGKWECFDMDYVSRCSTKDHLIPNAFSWCHP